MCFSPVTEVRAGDLNLVMSIKQGTNITTQISVNDRSSLVRRFGELNQKVCGVIVS